MEGRCEMNQSFCSLLVLCVGILFLLTGCVTETTQVVAPDMEPVGSGLRFLGIAVVVMALVFALAPAQG